MFVHRIAWQQDEWEQFTKGQLPFEGPMQTVSIAPGTYDAASIQTRLPEAWHTGYLPQNETFVVREGVNTTHQCTVPAGHYPTPAILGEAVAQALADATADVAVRVDSTSFVFTQSTPFLLDFSNTSRSLRLALGVQSKVYGPCTRFQTDGVQMPGHPYVYTVQQDTPHDARLCLQAMYPPIRDITTHFLPLSADSMLWLMPKKTVLPYQEDDIVFIFLPDAGHSHTARVGARGHMYKIDGLSVAPGTSVMDDQEQMAVAVRNDYFCLLYTSDAADE